MSKRALSHRITDLENRNPKKALFVAVWQDYTDKNLWHEEPAYRRPEGGMTWDQVEEKYKGYDIFQVSYMDNWRGGNDPTRNP